MEEFEDSSGEVPILVQLEDIRTTFRTEGENRVVCKTGLKLFDCLSYCISSLIDSLVDPSVSTEEIERFTSAKTLQLSVVNLLKSHAKNLKSVLPLLVDDMALPESEDNERDSKVYLKGVEEFYAKLTAECTDGDYYQDYTKLCLYASATCINIPVYVIGVDQQWQYFEPLFTFEGQPRGILRYITMYVSTETLFYKVESTDQNAPPPKATGLVGMYMKYLEDTPTRCIGVPEELTQIPESSKTKLCYSVSREVITECCDILLKIGLISKEDHTQLTAHRINRAEFCRKVMATEVTFETLCKVLIKRRAKSLLSPHVQDWSLFEELKVDYYTMDEAQEDVLPPPHSNTLQ